MIRDGTLRLHDGTELFRRSWMPGSPVRAALVVVHGFGEHSGRYDALVGALPAAGFAVHGFDHLGHGRSPGARGHIASWSSYRDAVGALVDSVGRESPTAPLFVYGHSMGGLVVLEWLVAEAAAGRSRTAGAILSAPGLIPLEVGKPWQIWASRVLSRILPGFSMDLSLGLVSSDPAAITASREDPLNHRRASVRWATEAMAAVERARAGASSVRVPLLVVHGDRDRIVDIAGSRWLVDAVGSGDRELRVYPAHHEVHNDTPRAALVEDLIGWLERRL